MARLLTQDIHISSAASGGPCTYEMKQELVVEKVPPIQSVKIKGTFCEASLSKDGVEEEEAMLEGAGKVQTEKQLKLLR